MTNAIDLTGKDFYHEPEDVETLAQLTRMLKFRSKIIVNIGVAFGTSMLALLQATESDVFIFGIDAMYCPDAINNLRGYEFRYAHIVGKSQEIGLRWPCKVDMVFVDGSHARMDVEADIRAWANKIWLGGIIAFDDYDKPICPGVKPAVDECMQGYRQVLRVGDIIAFEV